MMVSTCDATNTLKLPHVAVSLDSVLKPDRAVCIFILPAVIDVQRAQGQFAHEAVIEVSTTTTGETCDIYVLSTIRRPIPHRTGELSTYEMANFTPDVSMVLARLRSRHISVISP